MSRLIKMTPEYMEECRSDFEKALQLAKLSDGKLNFTYAEDADGNPIMIFKNPKTDTGHFKKSQRGCCRVVKDGDNYTYEDGLTWAEAQENNELRVVFKNGEFIKTYTLDEVRQNLHGGQF